MPLVKQLGNIVILKIKTSLLDIIYQGRDWTFQCFVGPIRLGTGLLIGRILSNYQVDARGHDSTLPVTDIQSIGSFDYKKGLGHNEVTELPKNKMIPLQLSAVNTNNFLCSNNIKVTI